MGKITVQLPIGGVGLTYVGGDKPVPMRRALVEDRFVPFLRQVLEALRRKVGATKVYTFGIYADRPVRGGTRKSLHAFGSAIDIAGLHVPKKGDFYVSDSWEARRQLWACVLHEIERASRTYSMELLSPSNSESHLDHIHWGIDFGFAR